MLGRSLHDPQGCDGLAFDACAGLGLLPLATHFEAKKRLRAASVRFTAPHGTWSALQGVVAPAYEIRCGHTLADDRHAVLRDEAGVAIGWQAGPVLGVYAHGLFESPAFIQALFGVAVPTLETAFETLADLVDEHLDAALLQRLLRGV
jgi:adenosylcobyric acid synthase